MQFVFDGPIGTDDEESARMAATEVIALFPSPWTLDDQILRRDYPAELEDYPFELRVYERKERSSEGKPLR